LSLSELPQARRLYEEALPIFRDIGDRLDEANCIQELGNVHVSLSELPQARRRYEEALSTYRDIGDRLGAANCIQALGGVAAEEGNLTTAADHFTNAAQQFAALQLPAHEANCYNSLGIMFHNHGCYPDALTALGKAIELFPDVNCYSNRAEPHMHLSDFAAAQRDLDAAAALNPGYDYLNFNQGRLALWQGQAQEALARFDRASATIPECGEFHLWRALALALTGAAWQRELQIGLERTHLARQIREVADAVEKLEATYGGAGALTAPIHALRAALAEQNQPGT
jgi:tetratricopeptide (TPR) repeat protein